MKIARLKIENFRGIQHCEIIFPDHTVLVGDNNSGKSTLLEAIDLVLGPERLSRSPVIDEHDFYAGQYLNSKGEIIHISVEVIVVGLSDEQKRHFVNHLEWWNSKDHTLINEPPPESTDQEGVIPALRLCFIGKYDFEEDDFVGRTFFCSPEIEDGSLSSFSTRDKRLCAFLFLRTLRTGTRALSLEHGSLLDIILKLKELRAHMWEDVLNQLRQLPVAEKSELGLTDVLTNIQDAIRSYVPADWADAPHLRVSDLTRTHLRKVLNVFMETGAKTDEGASYAAPYQHQGTGTINTLVLALLSMIAEMKQNVIFAMEEPEIAIPPHTQKRIVSSLTTMSAQAIFTSHSPYVIEEFKPNQVLVIKRDNGSVKATPVDYPPSVKPKSYRSEFRRRFCEALLARRVLITEGRTEYDALPVAARRLNELHPEEYSSLEAIGIALINAETETQVAPLGAFFHQLGKVVLAVFDKQTTESKKKIEASVDYAFESSEKGFENVIINGTDCTVLRQYAMQLVANNEWPQHFNDRKPSNEMTDEALKDALKNYLKWTKGEGKAADILYQCKKEQMPDFIISTIEEIQGLFCSTVYTDSQEDRTSELIFGEISGIKNTQEVE